MLGVLFLVPYNTSMALTWSQRRKTLYTTVLAVMGVVALVMLYQLFFSQTPTCFDGVQNGDEHGIDCGGSCALLCRNESQPPKVLWSRAFLTAPGTYTAAAYVENDNPGAGARRVGYAFQLFDADNKLIIEHDGVVDLPPVQTIAVIETNIPIPNRTPVRTLFSFAQEPVWYAIPKTQVPALKLSDQSLADDASRLSATLTNNTFGDVRAVTVAAVLFDATGTARAASRSVLSVAAKSSSPVVFTFPGGVPGIVRAEITILPPF